MTSQDMIAIIAWHYGTVADNYVTLSPRRFSPRALLIAGLVVLFVIAAGRAAHTQTQIDVLVAYTPAAEAAVTDIGATIALAVAEANQSYVNSAINIHLNFVASFQVFYTETGKNFDTILADFKGMSDVNRRRDQSGADLAVLIMDQSDACGKADAIMATASTAFAIVHFDCATGNFSFAHELGHLMGARHNEQADASTTPFAYGHGFRHDPSWRTIMSYDCPEPGCPRLQFWSNPNIMLGTDPMGTVATNDNARVLNETAATVAAFRPANIDWLVPVLSLILRE